MCRKCKYCTAYDGFEDAYKCEIEGWLPANIADDETLECDLFVEELDDNETKESTA